jgi:hypothetical protein
MKHDGLTEDALIKQQQTLLNKYSYEHRFPVLKQPVNHNQATPKASSVKPASVTPATSRGKADTASIAAKSKGTSTGGYNFFAQFRKGPTGKFKDIPMHDRLSYP